MSSAESKQLEAILLVATIEAALERGVWHFDAKTGKRLEKPQEIVEAMLRGEIRLQGEGASIYETLNLIIATHRVAEKEAAK